MQERFIEIELVKQETPETRSFYFKWINNNEPVYVAGQFITLILEIDGNEVRRSYSLASAPKIEAPFFTIKRIDNGLVSHYLYNYLLKGKIIKVLEPTGRYTLVNQANSHFFIAAGSGITPVFSMVKFVLHHFPGKRVVLVYQNSTEEHSIFRNDLLQLQLLHNASFTFIELFSNPAIAPSKPTRINNILLEKIVTEQVKTSGVQFYLCGPMHFMLLCSITLKVLGYKEERIKKEIFTTGPVTISPPTKADTAPRNVFLQWNENTYHFVVNYPDNILQAAIKNNIPLPYSCRAGKCSTCLATCLSGKIVMTNNEVLTDTDIKHGLVLTCVGFAETDIELVIR